MAPQTPPPLGSAPGRPGRSSTAQFLRWTPSNVAYRVVRSLARALLGLFYRRIEVVGLEHVPRDGPLVIVANHHNALVDPALLLSTIPRRPVPVAKAPLFRNPIVGPFLRLLGALPAHRRQDTATEARAADAARNAEMLARAAAALRSGRAVLIFPEGVSQPEPTVMPLRSGAARMVLDAESAGPGCGITVVPVGLVFENPGTFRTGRALVAVGKPVPIADALERRAVAPEPAARELIERIATALRALIVEAHDRQTLHLLEVAELVWRGASGERRGDAATRTAWMKTVLRGQSYLAAREAERVTRLRSELERYAKDLGLAGLTGRELTSTYLPRLVARYALREGLSLVVGLPLAVWGLAVHALPYQLTRLTVRILKPEADIEATYKLGAAMFLYPLCWALEGWLAWRVGGAPLLATFVALLLPSGFFALSWQERLDRVRRDARGFLKFLLDRDFHRRLVDRRQALRDELAALARLVPGSILSGEGAR